MTVGMLVYGGSIYYPLRVLVDREGDRMEVNLFLCYGKGGVTRVIKTLLWSCGVATTSMHRHLHT